MITVIVSDENDFNRNHISRTFDDEEAADEFIANMRDLSFNVFVWYPRMEKYQEQEE